MQDFFIHQKKKFDQLQIECIGFGIIVGIPPIDDVEMGDCHFFITLQFNHIHGVCMRGTVPFITFQIFSLLNKPCKILKQVFIVLNRGIIDTFLIHSGGLHKMLTALFDRVWNTEKSKWTIFE